MNRVQVNGQEMEHVLDMGQGSILAGSILIKKEERPWYTTEGCEPIDCYRINSPTSFYAGKKLTIQTDTKAVSGVGEDIGNGEVMVEDIIVPITAQHHAMSRCCRPTYAISLKTPQVCSSCGKKDCTDHSTGICSKERFKSAVQLIGEELKNRAPIEFISTLVSMICKEESLWQK